MSERADRFRRLKSSGRKPGSGDDAGTADLFEHFGVELKPPAPAPSELRAVEGACCRGCGWLLAYRRAEAACPVCGESQPLSAVGGDPP